MDNTIASFLVALGFDVNQNSLNTAKRSVADYEKAVREADARVMKARADNAKAEIQINARRDADRAKEALAAAQRAQQVEKAEQEQALKRRERASEFGAALSKMALAATAAATAIAFAVNRVTGAFDSLAFISQRTGASVQSLNSLGYAFKQVGGSSQQAVGAVESFARAMRENDGVKSYVKSLGVDTTKDAAEQLLDTVEKLSKHEYQVGFREAGLAGISEEDYNLITRQLGALRKYREEYDATAKRLGLNSEEAASASLAFQRALTRLQTTVSIVGQNLFTQLAPALERVAKGFNDWIASHPEKVDHILQSITRGITFLTEKMTGMVEWFAGSDGEKLTQRWDQFAARVDSVAKSLETIARFLDRISGFNLHATNTVWGDPKRATDILNGMGSGQGGGGGGIPGVGAVGGFNPLEAGGGAKDDRSLWQRIAPKWLGGRDRAGSIGKLAQGANAKAIIDELKGAGFNDNAIAAIVGSMQTESSLNPGARNGSGHTGLWQWDARKRWPKIEKWIRDQGGDPSDARWQTKAWVAEHSAKPGDALYDGAQTAQGGAMLRNNPSLDDAVTGVRMSERFGPGEEGGRAANARNWLSHLSGTAASSPGGITDISSRSNYRGGQMEGVKGFVMHHTAGRGTPEGVVDTLNQRGYGVQYVMDRDGKVYQTLPSGARGAHIRPAQNGSGLSNANTLGMEVIAKDDRDVTPAQVAAAKAFLEQQQKLYPGLQVFGHGEINGHKQETEGMTIVNAFRAGQAMQAWKGQRQSPRASGMNMTPGDFNVNSINPMDAMKAPPFGALGNTTTSNDNRAVNQTFHTTTTINEARNTREAGRVMAGTFGEMHALALRNAQSAVA